MTPKATEMLGAREVRLSEQWRVHTNAQRTAILNGWGHIVATVSSPEEAMRIMQCVGAHDELVEALRRLIDSHEALMVVAVESGAVEHYPVPHMDYARAALAKATGRAP